MTPQISEAITAAFNREGAGEGHRERVIITLRDRDAASAFAQSPGVTIISRMRGAPIVVAEIDAAGLTTLAANPAIERIEPDGEMRALSD